MLALQAVGVNTLDSSVFLWLNLGRDAPEALVWLAMACSRWLPAVLLTALVPLAALGGPRGRRTMWLALLGMGLAWAAAALLKHSVAAPRPFMLGLGTEWLGHSGGNGAAGSKPAACPVQTKCNIPLTAAPACMCGKQLPMMQTLLASTP